MPGPEHHDVTEEVGCGPVHYRLRLHHDTTAAPEPKQIQATESGGVLVLFADRLVKNLHFNVTCFLSELTGGDPLATEGMKRIEQADRKGARASHPGRCRHVGDGTDEDRRFDIQKIETLARNIVFDFA